MAREIKKCRICGNGNLELILSLGVQCLTGVFPRNKRQEITSGPLELVRCVGGDDVCGLVQLKHSYDSGEMYGDNYGYRSGLNNSMVKHLHNKVHEILNLVEIKEGDLVIDIGSNDSTLLQGYGNKNYLLVGVDPTGCKFKEYYPPYIRLIPTFFSKRIINGHFGNKKAKVVTSISMFYDLESPIDFAQEIYDILSDKGVWVLEQSYLPAMIDANAYDTICHEHLEYYSLRQIQWISNKVGFKIVDVKENKINGGSFSVILAKMSSNFSTNKNSLVRFSKRENKLKNKSTYQSFKRNVFQHREDLCKFLNKASNKGKIVLGYGASTKGNVILQFCNLTEKNIPYIAEVNQDKFGAFTPGTNIPIISEEEARRMRPDIFMVLPWHFKDNIIAKEREYLKSAGKLLFPLPSIEII